jgi:rRNA maturation protein Nop10
MSTVGAAYSNLEYDVDGFDYFELKRKFLFFTTSSRKNVIYLKITPNEALKDFRYRLAENLLKITDASDMDHDSKEKFQFHVTLAMKDIHQKFDDIWNYLQKYSIKTKAISYRITLLKTGRIVCEYDFVQKRILNRREALSRNGWQLTKKLLGNASQTEMGDDTQFYGCPHCGKDTEILHNKEYCSECEVFL